VDRTQKQQLVEALQQVLADTVCVVVTHQAGLNVAEVTQLRRQVRSAGAGYRVTKIVEFANRNAKLTIVGGGLAGRQMDAAEVRELASLPSLDELRGKLVGLLQTPGTRLAVVLQATAGQIARVLAAYAERQGEAISSPAG